MHPLRLYALWQGDESNDFVHIAMVHASNLLGFHLWQNLNSTFSLGTEEYLRALAEESLAMLEETSDAQVPAHVPTRLQVYCTLASYHLYCRRIDISREYLSRAAEVVKKANPEALTASALEAKFDPATVDGSPYMDARNGDEGNHELMSLKISLDTYNRSHRVYWSAYVPRSLVKSHAGTRSGARTRF